MLQTSFASLARMQKLLPGYHRAHCWPPAWQQCLLLLLLRPCAPAGLQHLQVCPLPALLVVLRHHGALVPNRPWCSYPDRNFMTASVPLPRLHVYVRRLVEAGHKVHWAAAFRAIPVTSCHL